MKVLLLTAFIFLFCKAPFAQIVPAKKTNGGIYVSFVSPDVKFKKDTVPVIPVKTSWNTRAWKGEKVHTKLLLWTTGPIQKVSLHCESLNSNNGNQIPARYISASFLEYVITDGLNAKGSGCGVTRGVDSSLVEDLISKRKIISIKANNSQPVWLSIQVPRNAKAGIYKGSVKVKNNSLAIGELEFTIEVINRILPEAKDWKFHLDLWQNPFAIARVHNAKLWSAQHLMVMRPYMQMLADAGQKTITASIIHDPWNSQTYDIYQSMVKWVKKKNGQWKYDYSIFDL
jgi:hypothetical protein